MIAEDLDAFLDDFGVPVSSGVVSGVGILDQNSEIALGGEAVFIDYLLTVKTSTFGALTYGDQVSVDGVGYKVESQPLRIDDGRFCRVPLVRLTGDAPPEYIVDGGAAEADGILYDGGGA